VIQATTILVRIALTSVSVTLLYCSSRGAFYSSRKITIDLRQRPSVEGFVTCLVYYCSVYN
jgi:hypothetical protein